MKDYVFSQSNCNNFEMLEASNELRMTYLASFSKLNWNITNVVRGLSLKQVIGNI